MSNLLKDYSYLVKLILYLIIIIIFLVYILLTVEMRDNYNATIIKDKAKNFIISKNKLNGNLFLLRGKYFYFEIVSFNKISDSDENTYQYEVKTDLEIKSYLNFENITIVAKKKTLLLVLKDIIS